MYIQQLHKNGIKILFFFYIITYIIPLNNRLLWQPDETRYAEISREMLQKDNWMIPYLLGIRYFEKPVAGYWINNISQLIFGNNNFAVRFGSVFSTTISALLIYILAILMWKDKNIALISFLIYITMFLIFTIGTYSVLDPILTMWLNASMLCCFVLLNTVSKIKIFIFSILTGFTCGMGFMTKGFIAIVIPVIIIIPIIFYQKKIFHIFKIGIITFISIGITTLYWILTIHKKEPDYWHYFFWIEHIHRFFSNNAQHKSPFWFYIPVLIIGVIPWLGLLIYTLIDLYKQKKLDFKILFLIYWFVLPLIFFSFAKGKLITYILPIISPLVLTMAKYSIKCITINNMKPFKINGIINIVFGILIIIILIIIGKIIKNPIYTKLELYKLILSIIIFLIWIFISYLSLLNNAKYWLYGGLCSIALSLFISDILPQDTIDSKLPQNIIRNNQLLLHNSDFLLTNNIGIATGLAWELKHNNIYLYENSGELKYGLNYYDSKYRLITKNTVIQWLCNMRQKKKVSIILFLNKKDNSFKFFPNPDILIYNTKIIIMIYYPKIY